jgi:hypothetical protein
MTDSVISGVDLRDMAYTYTQFNEDNEHNSRIRIWLYTAFQYTTLCVPLCV